MNRRAVLVAAGSFLTSLAGCIGGNSEDQPTPQPTERPTATATDSTRTPTGTATPTNRATDTRTDTKTATESSTPTETEIEVSVACSGTDHEFLGSPDGFSVTEYANSDELGGGPFSPGPDPGPRMMAVYDGTLFATIPEQGRVVALPDDGAGGLDRLVTVNPEELNRPHGIGFHGDTLFLACADRVVRYRMNSLDATDGTVLVEDIPEGVYHWTRSLAVTDDRLYLSVGNCPSGNCSDGTDEYHAAVTALDHDGSNRTTYATGLRNAVGIEYHDGTLFVTDNGIDDLGPNLPADEINVIEQGRDYGYPDCYGDNVPVDGASETDCEGRATPRVKLQAHVAPLGFCFADTAAFPQEYRGDMYVALHGSWARDDPVGYKVIRVPYDGELGEPSDFVTGWMPDGGTNEDARGRPADVHVGPDGAMYVSDDLSGTIYRVCYCE
jgi:glucose/arabinose dehydrogenase